MDLLIICLGTRKIMLQCITCRVQTSTLNISGKPTIVIIWIFYNMKNASVKVGGVALKRSLDMVGLQGQTKSLHFTPHFRQNVFETLNHLISILQYFEKLQALPMHTLHHKNSHHAKFKKNLRLPVQERQPIRATKQWNIFQYNYYVTNIVNYFVLFFNVLDLYIFLLNDIDVITSKKQTWKVIKVFIIIITIIIIAMFET